MARLTAPNGAVVVVDSGKVDALLSRGFTASEEPKKAPAKKTAAKRASSSSSDK